MALSVEQTKELIRSEKNLNPEVAQILFNNEGGSDTGSGNLWAYLHALASNLLSQLMDIFVAEVNQIVYVNIPATPQWIKMQVEKFQSGDDIKIDETTFAVYYELVDETKRIATRVSVKTDNENNVSVKVAKNEPPEPFDPTEQTALQSYLNEIKPAGVRYLVISKDADRLYLKAQIFYVGQYSDVIEDNVKTAIETYLSAIPFDGIMKITDLEAAVRSVEGVNDIVIESLYCREATTPFVSASELIEDYQLTSPSNRRWETISGYMIPEDTSGSALDDSLTFSIDG